VAISERHIMGASHFFVDFVSCFLPDAAAGFSAGFLSAGFFSAGAAGAAANCEMRFTLSSHV